MKKEEEKKSNGGENDCDILQSGCGDDCCMAEWISVRKAVRILVNNLKSSMWLIHTGWVSSILVIGIYWSGLLSDVIDDGEVREVAGKIASTCVTFLTITVAAMTILISMGGQTMNRLVKKSKDGKVPLMTCMATFVLSIVIESVAFILTILYSLCEFTPLAYLSCLFVILSAISIIDIGLTLFVCTSFIGNKEQNKTNAKVNTNKKK